MSNDIAKTNPPATLKTFLASRKDTIAQALEGTALTAERLLSVTMTEVRKTPALRECTQASLFGSLVQAAQLGLEPGSALGHCYLIPYNNKRAGVVECQFQIGYKGMLDLARRSGQVQRIYAYCVREKDHFEVQLGTDDRLIHKPCITENPGEIVGAYAVAHLTGGGAPQFRFLPRWKLDEIRNGSRSGNSGPWVTHFEEMANKTAIRSLFKLLPVSIQALTGASLDEQAEAGLRQNNAAVFGDEGSEAVTIENTAGALSAADLNDQL